MRERPSGFIGEEKVDHNGEVFDYIRELHEYLWRFVRLFSPSAGGSLSDCLDDILDDAESRRRLT